MKTMNNTWMKKGMALVAMMVISIGMMAQGRLVVTEHGIGRAASDRQAVAPRQEVRHDAGRYDSRDMRHEDVRYDRRDSRKSHGNKHMDVRPGGGVHVEDYAGHGHHIPPHYADRVRYVDGHWGYLRGNHWYYYDTYFEPDYYYSHPVRHFHKHRLGPVGKAVVTTAAVVSLVGLLAH